jgi:tetratricopeptide (TPR) repeat protein
MLQSASRSLGLALLAGLLLAGCSDNLFSGLQSEGTSDDPQVLLADAQAALAKGDTTRALDYLERAHDLEPENAEVRVTLVGTRFEKHDVDLLTIREIGQYIASGGNPSVTAKAAPNYVCSFEEDPSNYATFDFAAAPSFQRLVDLNDLFADAETLIGDLDATQVDLPDDLRARMLLIRAFMQAFKTIKEIDYEVKQLGVQLFRLPNNDLGICADANQLSSISDAQQIVDDIQDLITCTLLPGYEQAMEDLRTRNRLLNGSEDNIVIDVMSDALDAMRNSLNAECTTN